MAKIKKGVQQNTGGFNTIINEVSVELYWPYYVKFLHILLTLIIDKLHEILSDAKQESSQ